MTEASYHALAAAMLCAEAASNRKALQLVIELAYERQREIDAEGQLHLWSTGEALARGAAPLFESLARTADASLARTAEATRGRSKRGQGPRTALT